MKTSLSENKLMNHSSPKENQRIFRQKKQKSYRELV
jgi:hypothetical protein